MEIKQVLFQYNELISFMSLVIGFLGLAFAYYFFKKSQRVRKSYYHKKSFNLIDESLSELPNLEFSYKSKNVNNLTVTKIAIWNSGNETIDKNHLIESDPVRIVPA